jgi:hypothetical protein
VNKVPDPRRRRIMKYGKYWSCLPHRNDLKDLCASGEEPIRDCGLALLVSRIRPPLIFGVWAQNAQTYTGGRLRRSIPTHSA